VILSSNLHRVAWALRTKNLVRAQSVVAYMNLPSCALRTLHMHKKEKQRNQVAPFCISKKLNQPNPYPYVSHVDGLLRGHRHHVYASYFHVFFLPAQRKPVALGSPAGQHN
jgi:hypothetical protein